MNTQQSIPLIINCPSCYARHIDEGEFATKPHHTHACQNCGLTWRPAIVNTVGVQFLPGFKNEVKPEPILSVKEGDWRYRDEEPIVYYQNGLGNVRAMKEGYMSFGKTREEAFRNLKIAMGQPTVSPHGRKWTITDGSYSGYGDTYQEACINLERMITDDIQGDWVTVEKIDDREWKVSDGIYGIHRRDRLEALLALKKLQSGKRYDEL